MSEGVETHPLANPSIPLRGWELLSKDSSEQLNLPTVTSGL